MPEPHTSLIAGLSAIGGSLITGLIVVFRSGRAYEKVIGNIENISAMLDAHVEDEESKMFKDGKKKMMMTLHFLLKTISQKHQRQRQWSSIYCSLLLPLFLCLSVASAL